MNQFYYNCIYCGDSLVVRLLQDDYEKLHCECNKTFIINDVGTSICYIKINYNNYKYTFASSFVNKNCRLRPFCDIDDLIKNVFKFDILNKSFDDIILELNRQVKLQNII